MFRSGGDNHSVTGFSALQRAENSSTVPALSDARGRIEFQCSSASRKFLNETTLSVLRGLFGFSALQRAENSSRINVNVASPTSACFSALQRAENSSSITILQNTRFVKVFQCSSASRKFLNLRAISPTQARTFVSVLFSEPKIPQDTRRILQYQQ